nr:formin-like protein 3 [Lolium perenne]
MRWPSAYLGIWKTTWSATRKITWPARVFPLLHCSRSRFSTCPPPLPPARRRRLLPAAATSYPLALPLAARAATCRSPPPSSRPPVLLLSFFHLPAAASCPPPPPPARRRRLLPTAATSYPLALPPAARAATCRSRRPPPVPDLWPPALLPSSLLPSPTSPSTVIHNLPAGFPPRPLSRLAVCRSRAPCRSDATPSWSTAGLQVCSLLRCRSLLAPAPPFPLVAGSLPPLA